MEIHLEQGSQEWLEYRKTRIGASDAAVIMGLSPWSSPFDLYMEKVEGIEKTQTYAMKRGQELEAEAREYFENLLGVRFRPAVFQHDKYDWMMASLDGISEDGKIWIEIKCPSSITSHIKAMNGEIAEYYKAQMHHQKECVPTLERGIFCSWYDGSGEVIELEKDTEFTKRMLKEEKKFYDCMVNKSPPDSNKKQEFFLETSDEFLNISEKYKELDLSIKMMTEEKAIIRERLIEIAADRDIKGNGIAISKKMTKGVIDYKSMPNAFRDEIEKFRSAPAESWTIRID